MDREILKKIPLFRSVSPEDAERMLGCLNAVRRRYEPEERILWAGQAAERLGAVLEGKVQIIREDEDGTRTILAGAGPGELFAEAFACAGGATLPVSVLAMTPCEVLLIEPGRIATGCSATCACHSRLIANMLTVLADKNLFLNRRLGHLSKRSTRDKLLSYLEEQAAGRADEFTIPFTRAELADYLCVERSAMSTVLSRLRAEGLVETRGRRFRLHTHPH